MAEYIDKQAAVDAGYLSDWYISSVGDEPPVWTDAHIDELLNDFIVIPKDTKAADVQPVKHGKWLGYACSECHVCADYFVSGDVYFDMKPDFCPFCGARMDGEK